METAVIISLCGAVLTLLGWIFVPRISGGLSAAGERKAFGGYVLILLDRIATNSLDTFRLGWDKTKRELDDRVDRVHRHIRAKHKDGFLRVCREYREIHMAVSDPDQNRAAVETFKATLQKLFGYTK